MFVEVTLERTYATKFMANHYLSWNVSNRLNLGFFESVIWTNTNDRGFQFYQSYCFLQVSWVCIFSERTEMRYGANNKYKWNDQIMYGQFLLDEFSLGILKGEITAGKINMVISWVSNTTMHSTLIIYCCS
jgi:hypothetical protein